jgi:RNA polymerase sigma-70 factor (ECF subfamily)
MRTLLKAAGGMCESEAIEKSKIGDSSGMTRLYELYRPRIYSQCFRFSKNAFDADDLTQDVFIQLFRKISTFRGDAEFKTWLYKVVLNTARLHARRLRRHRELISADETDGEVCSAESLFRNPTHKIALAQALSSLTPIRRTTLLLHDVQGLTHNEVASLLGVTVIASKSRLHRAHMALRTLLGSRSSGSRGVEGGQTLK